MKSNFVPNYIVTQFITVHEYLKKKYLKQRGITRYEECECVESQTSLHLLLKCPQMALIRNELEARIGHTFMTSNLNNEKDYKPLYYFLYEPNL